MASLITILVTGTNNVMMEMRLIMMNVPMHAKKIPAKALGVHVQEMIVVT